MQAGASLFAITVNVSSLIESPPASLITVQGDYAFNPDLFWEKFPSLVLLTLLLALVFNWKNSLRKWILGGGLVWVLSGVVVLLPSVIANTFAFPKISFIFVLLSPAQEAFLSTEFSNTVNQELMELGKTWRNYSLLFMALSAISGLIYLSGLFSNNKEM